MLRLLSAWLLVLVAWTAAAAERAGQVVLARGEVRALAADGAARELRRRSPVFTGDTIVTGEGGRVQVRLTDGTLIALRPGSRFRIEDYHLDPQGGAERNVSRLLEGGFRTLTGAISKRNPDAYAVETPVATIGVRGTHYEAVLDEGLVVGVYEGRIDVANVAGRMELGADADFRFARIPAADRPPAGLLRPPPALGEVAPLPAQGKSRPRPPKQGARPPKRPPGPREKALASTGLAPAPPSLIVPVDVPSDVPVVDHRFLPLEWQRLVDEGVFGMFTGERLPWVRLDGGRAVADTAGRPVLTSTGKWPFDPGVADAPITHVLRRGDAPALGVADFPIEPGYVIHWGMWNGGADPATPVLDQTDPLDPAVIDPVDQKIFWATARPTPPGALSLRSDTVRFDKVLGVIGGGSGGPLLPAQVVRFGATVDFANGSIADGLFEIDQGDFWHVEFGGQIRGSFADMKVLPGSVVTNSVVTRPVKGAIGGVFTGSRGDVLLGGFRFEDSEAPARHVEGMIQVAPGP